MNLKANIYLGWWVSTLQLAPAPQKIVHHATDIYDIMRYNIYIYTVKFKKI